MCFFGGELHRGPVNTRSPFWKLWPNFGFVFPSPSSALCVLFWFVLFVCIVVILCMFFIVPAVFLAYSLALCVPSTNLPPTPHPLPTAHACVSAPHQALDAHTLPFNFILWADSRRAFALATLFKPCLPRPAHQSMVHLSCPPSLLANPPPHLSRLLP